MPLRPEIATCPSCGGEVVIRRYHCPRCDVTIEGAFERNRFSRLSPEALDFLLVFVKNRGNLREIERELGISYPTVRNRLNRLIAELGLTDEQRWTPEQIAEERKEILRELDAGKLTPTEAEELLQALKRLEQNGGEG